MWEIKQLVCVLHVVYLSEMTRGCYHLFSNVDFALDKPTGTQTCFQFDRKEMINRNVLDGLPCVSHCSLISPFCVCLWIVFFFFPNTHILCAGPLC